MVSGHTLGSGSEIMSLSSDSWRRWSLMKDDWLNSILGDALISDSVGAFCSVLTVLIDYVPDIVWGVAMLRDGCCINLGCFSSCFSFSICYR